LTRLHELPDGVRRQADSWQNLHHEYLQFDGRWQRCADRRHCRECIREDTMKSTMDKLREALEQHFGAAHMRSIHPDFDLFGASAMAIPEGKRGLGDHTDRMEMLGCIEIEFGVILPDEDAYGSVTLEILAKKIDAMLESRGEK
jgi:hypothetical protein